MVNFSDKISFIWRIAELMRGTYKSDKDLRSNETIINY